MFSSRGAVPNTPKGKTSPPNGKVLVPRVPNYLWCILRPNTHVAFESYQSHYYFLIRSNTNTNIIEEDSC